MSIERSGLESGYLTIVPILKDESKRRFTIRLFRRGIDLTLLMRI